MKLFEIDDYTLWENEIEVFLFKGEQEKTIFIPRQEFEKWMEDRMDYCNDSVDHNGEHQQVTGTFSIDQFWNDVNIDKYGHLYDWIVLNRMDYVYHLTVEPAISMICHAFSHVTNY